MRSWVLGLLMVLAVGSVGMAQTITSAILKGSVKDPTGAVVPNASIVLKNSRTGAERKATSTADGSFSILAVDPGTYSLVVEAGGFKKYNQTDLQFGPAENKGIDVNLQVGAASETINISGTAAEEVKTETGERSNTIRSNQIENFSLISRNSLELLRVLPGVVAPDSSTLQLTGFYNAGDASNYNVNGQRGNNNNVSVDGSRTIDIGCGCGNIISLNNDMVGEINVQGSNFAAEHGNSGVNIQATTKGGGKDFHGSVYTYVRHDALAANDRFRNYVKAADPVSGAIPGAKPPGRFYYPGGNIGGPVTLPKSVFGPLGGYNEGRDKLFFFVGFEIQRQTYGPDPKTAIVPSAKMRNGDFSELLTKTLPNQNTNVKIPGGFANAGANAPNNNLAPYIHPFGKAMLNLLPLPNFNDPTGNANYISTPTAFSNRKDLKMRFDYRFSDKATMYVRVTRETQIDDGAYGFWWGASNVELPQHNSNPQLGRSVAVGLTKVFSPTMTNEVVVSGSRLKLDNDFTDPSKMSLQGLGMQSLQLPWDARFGRQSNIVPQIINWAGMGQLWYFNTPIFAYNDSFSVADNLSKVKGSHTLKFGAVIEQGNKAQNFQDNSNGQLVLNQWGPNSTGDNFGDILVGQFGSVAHDRKIQQGNFRFYNYEFYAQDSWKLKKNFTLEYGLRASHLTTNKERKGFDVLFDPSTYKLGAGYYINGNPFQPNGIVSAAKGQIPKGAVIPPAVEWAPRLNFAWDIKGNSDIVVRGGAGFFYNRVQGNAQYDATLRSAVNGNVGANIGSGTTVPGTGGKSFDQIGGLTWNNLGLVDPLSLASGGSDITVPNPDSTKFPTTITTSLSVSKRLPFQSVLEVAYVGTFARHLADRRNINVIPLGALLKGTVPGDPGSTITQLANPNCNPNVNGDCKVVTTTGVKADLTNPIVRAALDGGALNKFRPYPDLGNLLYQEYEGTSNYHSLQATFSRQMGKSLQFYATYTFSKVLGTLTGDTTALDPLDARGRSYGVLDYDRTHIFNLSYNYYVPDLARGSMKNAFTAGVFNGWQMSGITTFSSGTPFRLRFSGDIVSNSNAIANFGSNAFAAGSNQTTGAVAPQFISDPRSGGTNVGDLLANISAIGFPAFGSSGPSVAPIYLRTPNRSNWDLSVFKNFKIKEGKTLQFRSGFFNIFNQAFAKNVGDDFNLTLNTICNVKTTTNFQYKDATGTPQSFTATYANGIGGTVTNVCDATKGFHFDDSTLKQFGKIKYKRGNRVIELALKFTF